RILHGAVGPRRAGGSGCAAGVRRALRRRQQPARSTRRRAPARRSGDRAVAAVRVHRPPRRPPGKRVRDRGRSAGVSVDVRLDPVLACNFRISLTDSTSALAAVANVALSTVLSHPLGGFSECTGLEMSLDVQEFMEGGGNDTVLKFPTRMKQATL